ncbi:MAG: putative Ig domain-containing protein, partial [Akkermansiaceae bacterium]|nr:putative Ig domain-containing protein [Akkermansiaceae bacterium]
MKTAFTRYLTSSAARLAGGSGKLITSLGVALVTLASAVPANADVWLDETFEQYTAASPPTAPTVTLSPQLNTAAIATVISSGGNKLAQYAKTTAAATGGSFTYSLSSPNFSTPRPKGFISFKVTANATPSASVAGSYLAFRLGANDVNSVGSTASAFVDVRLYQPATTFGVKVYSANTQSGGNTTLLPAGTNIIRVWYNSDTVNTMAYTDPSGVARVLNTASYAAYVNTVSINGSPTGSLLASSVTTSIGVTSSVIGKIGFTCTSANTADFSVDDIYAADAAPAASTAPAITSSTTATAYTNVPFSYQISTDVVATSYALASGTLPGGLSLNTTTGSISGTPTATGSATVGLTATNAVGTGTAVSLAITVGVPVNTFSGSNTSLNTSGSWSIGAAPNASTSAGSYMDVTLASSVTNLTTTSGSFFVKSWNVSNGSSYTLSSVKSGGNVTGSNSTSFK